MSCRPGSRLVNLYGSVTGESLFCSEYKSVVPDFTGTLFLEPVQSNSLVCSTTAWTCWKVLTVGSE